jgi:hypothetical protein
MIMHKISAVLLALTLVGCERSPASDTVQSLLANPERLKEVQRLCKEDAARMGATCAAASEAFRRRFSELGQPQYTPVPASKN